jgi:hypothetical protein
MRAWYYSTYVILLSVVFEVHVAVIMKNNIFRNLIPCRLVQRAGVTGGWRKLHIEELYNLYSSSSIIRMIKSRRMRRARHVARMGRRGMHVEYWWESLLDIIKMDLSKIG